MVLTASLLIPHFCATRVYAVQHHGSCLNEINLRLLRAGGGGWRLRVDFRSWRELKKGRKWTTLNHFSENFPNFHIPTAFFPLDCLRWKESQQLWLRSCRFPSITGSSIRLPRNSNCRNFATDFFRFLGWKNKKRAVFIKRHYVFSLRADVSQNSVISPTLCTSISKMCAFVSRRLAYEFE